MRRTTKAFSFEANVKMYGYTFIDIAISGISGVAVSQLCQPLLPGLFSFILIPIVFFVALNVSTNLREKLPRHFIYYLAKFYASGDHLCITNDRKPIPLRIRNYEALIERKSVQRKISKV